MPCVNESILQKMSYNLKKDIVKNFIIYYFCKVNFIPFLTYC